MGLSRVLARLASRRLHVLVVEHPGAFLLRARAERACTTRGWVLATSPADADVLLECGASDDERLTTAVGRVWAQVPGPRSRGGLLEVDRVDTTLDALADAYRRWSAEDEPRPEPEQHHPDDMADMHDMDGAHDMGDMEMDMSGPGGIALASGFDDERDGLEMDVLHVPLGPVLSSWPAGLVVTCTLTGDVVSSVEVDVIPDDTNATPTPDGTAYRLDAAARLLDLAGAVTLAARARRERDHVLDDKTSDLDDLRRRVGRSGALRWSLRRVGTVSGQQADGHGWPSAWVGDAHDRLLWLIEARTDPDFAATGLGTLATALPDLLRGSEIAAVRLTVASLVGHPS